MNNQALTAITETYPMAMPEPEQRSTGTNAIIFSEQRIGQLIRIAELMASGKATIPQHLRSSSGDCLAICLQSAQWGLNPFTVAQKTHVINGTLSYESQLVIAVINACAPIQGRLKYEWEGDWTKAGKDSRDESLACTCSATFMGDTEPTKLRVSMAQVGSTRNSPLWAADPRQQLAYLTAKRWARLHCPDVILGMYSQDEIEPHEPQQPESAPQSRAAAIKARLAQQRRTIDVAPDVAPSVAVQSVLAPQQEPTECDAFSNLLKMLRECGTKEELHRFKDEVAALKNGQRKEAVKVWQEMVAAFDA